MPLPHAYTYLYTVQLRRRFVKLASPCPLLNASCTALQMHRNAYPLAPPPLVPLSMWILVHPASHHLLMLLVQVPVEKEMWLMKVPTLPVASQLLIGLQPLLVVVMSTQGVQVPTLVLLMDDGLCLGSAGRGNSASPSSYLLTVHDDDDFVTHLLSIQNASHGGSSNGEDCDGVDRGVTHARL